MVDSLEVGTATIGTNVIQAARDPPTVIDRLPPQNVDSEQAVLGSILIDRDAIIEVADFLHPEDFYRQAHGTIFAAMLGLFEHREPIDVVTVAEALERDNQLESVGGASYLSTLGNDTPTAVHVAPESVERQTMMSYVRLGFVRTVCTIRCEGSPFAARSRTKRFPICAFSGH